MLHDTRRNQRASFDHQLRVAVVGDSLAAGIGYFAERVFKPFFVEVVQAGRISTGLARPELLQLAAQMQQIVERADPDLVLVMLARKNNQGLLDWDAVRSNRTWQLRWAHTTKIGSSGSPGPRRGVDHVLWIGLPNERDPGRWDFIQRRKAPTSPRRSSDRLPNMAYFDTWDAFRDPPGGCRAYYREGDGVTQVRTDDGVHVNTDGYTLLMQKVAEFATEALPARPEDLRELIRLKAS